MQSDVESYCINDVNEPLFIFWPWDD